MLSRPDTPDHLLTLSRALTEFAARFDLTPKRNTVVYCFDSSTPGWEHDPAAWFDPSAEQIVINLGKVWKSIVRRSALNGSGTVVTGAYASDFTKKAAESFVLDPNVLNESVKLIEHYSKSANLMSSFSTFADSSGSVYSDSTVLDVHDELAIVLSSDARTTPLSTSSVVADTLIAVLLHETGHAVFSRSLVTKNESWTYSLSRYEMQVLLVLEELRCERQQITRIGAGEDLLRYAADIVVSPSTITEDIEASRSSGGVSRAGFALNVSLYLGRAQYGVFRGSETDSVADFVRSFVGRERLDRMRDVWSRYSSVREEDADAMISCVSDWTDMFPEDKSASSSQAPVGGEKSEKNGFGIKRRDDSSGSSINYSRDDLESAVDEHSDDSTDKVDFSDLDSEFGGRMSASVVEVENNPSDSESNSARRTSSEKSYAMSFSIPEALESLRLSKKIKMSDPSPFDYELVNRLVRDFVEAKLSSRVKTRIPSQIPPGRIDMRAAVQMRADRIAGRSSNLALFSRSKKRVVESAPVSVAVLTDVSSSHQWAQDFNARMAFIVCSAVKRIHGRAAAVSFGSSVTVVLSPNEHPSQLVTIAAVDPVEEFDRACGTADHLLKLTASDGVKIVVVVTDGMMVKPYEMAKTAAWVKAFHEAGCAVVWVTPYGRDYASPDGTPLVPDHAHPIVVDRSEVASDPTAAVEQIVAIVKRAVVDANR